MKKLKVSWSRRAVASLEYYCNKIAEESPSSAEKVKKEIVSTAGKLSKNATLYQLDEYYPNNNGDIRRFFRWSYRVVYKVREDSVMILNVFRTGKHPDKIR